MAATDGQIVGAAARWCDEGQYLRELVVKTPLPTVVKVVKGQYGGLGVPSLPSPGLQTTAVVVSAGRRRKIIAQAIKLKDGRRVVGVGPRLIIPDTYDGYFELLSEEGRAVRCIESVAELARRRPEGGCLVREPVRVIVARCDSEGTVTADGARTLAVGETLMIAGEATLGGAKGKYLRCLDSRGDSILLGLDQRGRFSAIAKEDNISGVHTARNLLSKRLPLTVRLVHGAPPRGLKSSSHFVADLRLLSAFEEEHVFALPLQKDSIGLIALPLAAPLKLQCARNQDQLHGLREFHRLVEKCNRLMDDVSDRIQVLDGKLGDAKAQTRIGGGGATSQASLKSGYFIRRSASTDSAGLANRARDENRAEPPRVIPTRIDDYDEIDQIYDYVRGFAPLPKSTRTPLAESQPLASPPRDASPPISPISTPGHLAYSDGKPEPPPIETIPTRRQGGVPAPAKAEKRARRTSSAATKESSSDKNKPPLSKLYIKNSNSKGSHLLRQKSCSPMKELPSSPLQGKSGSPLFNIRYKSLTSLQQAMELSGTLDSSQSGGRTSGDSGAGAKLPEKRCRKLSRPRSLTNLVWDLRGPILLPDPMLIDRLPAKPTKPTKPSRLEPGVHRRSSSSKITANARRQSTLYL